jgi:hypothetical protein
MRITQRTGDVRLASEADVYTPSRTPWQRAPLLPSNVPPPPFAWLLWPFIIVALTGLTFSLGPAACSSTAAAQENDRYKSQLALELAVVAAHEGALYSLRDTALIYQVLEARASTDRSRLALLRAHSPRALGISPCAGGNCTWSVELLRAPSRPPASMDAAWWNAARADAWALVQRKALGLVYGVDNDRPCSRAPYTWGGAMDLEGAYDRRGLVPIGCEGTANDGFAFMPRSLRVLSADVAKGSNP